MATIEVINCGPIHHVSIDLPEGGGLVVLRGTNDIGKSEAIKAVEAALTGRGKIEVRSGCAKGAVTGLGVDVNVGRTMRRIGDELAFSSLEGKFNIEDLIEPKVKDPLAADAKRIKTLIQITGQKADPALFYDLLGGREAFDEVVSKAAVETEDLVVMADRIKRDLESAARKKESQAEHAEGRAKGAHEAAAAVDLAGESDPTKLGAALEGAIRIESALKEKAAGYLKAKRAADMARDQLEDQELSYTGPTAARCREKETLETARVDATEKALRAAEKALRAAEEALRKAQASHERARNDLASAIQARKAAERHEALVTQFREQLDAALPSPVLESELAEASQRVEAAREAVERGALIRRAKEHLAEAERIVKEAGEHRRKADQLRTTARGTEDVLSALVASSGTPLRVEAGRLMVDTDRGPKTFAELSHGTRSRKALDIAIKAVGHRGLIPLKQEFWEGIAPAKKLELADYVRGRGVWVLTAQATDDPEIVAEVL